MAHRRTRPRLASVNLNSTRSLSWLQATLKRPTTPAIKQTKLLIDNKWVDPVDGGTFETFNPATGEVIAKVAAAGTADVDQAVKAARQALETGPWKKMDAADRGRLLFKLADLIERTADELAALESLNCGKTITDSHGRHARRRQHAPLLRRLGRQDRRHAPCPSAATSCRYTLRQPVGVVGQIIPWNFPLLMLAWKWGPALACGNTIVHEAGRADAADRPCAWPSWPSKPASRRRHQHHQRLRRDRRRRPGASIPTSTRSPSPATSIPPRSSRRPPPTR